MTTNNQGFWYISNSKVPNNAEWDGGSWTLVNGQYTWSTKTVPTRKAIQILNVNGYQMRQNAEGKWIITNGMTPKSSEWTGGTWAQVSGVWTWSSTSRPVFKTATRKVLMITDPDNNQYQIELGEDGVFTLVSGPTPNNKDWAGGSWTKDGAKWKWVSESGNSQPMFVVQSSSGIF